MKTGYSRIKTGSIRGDASSRARKGAAALMVIAMLGCSKKPEPQAALPLPMVETQSETEQEAPPFDFGPQIENAPKKACRAFPQIDEWAGKRRIESALVRAYVLTESDFDPCAAGKACAGAVMTANSASGCLPADGSGNSVGYSAGLDEMHDPAGKCDLRNPPPGASPAWRWMGLGLMQTPHPPYTYWEETGKPGIYNDIYKRSGIYQLDLNEASACSGNFNPFSPADSICLGTGIMQRLQARSRLFISTHRSLLDWGPDDTKRDRVFAMYLTGNMYAGIWDSATRKRDFNHAFPSCSGSLPNGECWTRGYFESRIITESYCMSGEGLADRIRCKEGQPRQEPPQYCYGYNDVIKFIRECRIPYITPSMDPGSDKVRAYYALRNTCR